MITENDVLELLKKKWRTVVEIIKRRPDLCEKLVSEFCEVCNFAEELTGKRYTVVEGDGVIEY